MTRDPSDQDELEVLLCSMPPRRQPPEPLAAAVREGARTEWRATVRRRRLRRTGAWGGALAATILLAVMYTGSFVSLGQTVDLQLMQDGSLSLAGRQLEAGWQPVALDTSLRATRAVRVRTVEGADVRLAGGTSVRWLNEHRIRLERGALFLDTHDQSGFVIETDRGEVRDIGTQFLVVQQPESLELAVRVGSIEWNDGANRQQARADDGETRVIQVSDSGTQTFAEPPGHPRWDWILQADPDYRGETVRDVLQVLSSHLGKRLVFASRGAELAAINQRVQGDLTALPPALALQAVVGSAGLQLTEAEAELVVDVPGPADGLP